MKYFDVSMKSSRDSFERSEMFTRRTATVIMSAPEASCARTITAWEEYFPVPTMSRDENVLPAIVKVSTFISQLSTMVDRGDTEGRSYSSRFDPPRPRCPPW